MLNTEGGDDDRCGGESSSESSAELNPLQNVVILHHLFERCPPDVLATCRLVCKQWYEESLLTWRNSTPLKFSLANGHIYMEYGKPIFIPGNGKHQYTQLPLETYLECMADPKIQFQRKPYRYIRLQNSLIDSDIANKEQFDIFWNALGSNLTTLELIGCEFHDDEFRRIIFTHCPKLKRLFINDCEFPTTQKDSIEVLVPLDHKEQPFEPNNHLKHVEINCPDNFRDRKLPFSWLEEMFSHFPLMSSLTIEPDYQMSIDELDSLAKIIRKVRKTNGKLMPLKVIDVGPFTFGASADPSVKQRLAIFKELRLPLKKLHVHDEPGIDEVLFGDVVAFCAKTLKELHLRTMSTGPSLSESPFRHQLDNMRILRIVNCFRKYFTLLEYVPNLERLGIIKRGGRGKYQKITIPYTDPELADLKMKKLTWLELLVKFSDDDIAKITDWMPNVTKLVLIETNDKQFGIVCKQWRNLKKLTVFGDGLTDNGVAGMKNKGANITNLQNLEEFSFQCPKLSARSVFHGFLQLPILRVLAQLPGVKQVRWGERTRRALLDRNIRLEGTLDDTYYRRRY